MSKSRQCCAVLKQAIYLQPTINLCGSLSAVAIWLLRDNAKKFIIEARLVNGGSCDSKFRFKRSQGGLDIGCVRSFPASVLESNQSLSRLIVKTCSSLRSVWRAVSSSLSDMRSNDIDVIHRAETREDYVCKFKGMRSNLSSCSIVLP
jgi:hypothetical protein